MPTLISEAQVSQLVEELVRKFSQEPAAVAPKGHPAPDTGVCPGEGVFATVDEAVEAAFHAYQAFSEASLERRRVFIEAMRQAAVAHAEEYARLNVEETKFGRSEHKVQKILAAARKTPGVEDLRADVCTGDHGMTLVEAAPFGVIGAVTPCTNPVSTIVNNSISILSAGNTVVFNPHPTAKNISNLTVRTLNRAIFGAGSSIPLIHSVADPTLDTSQALVKHPRIRMLLITGGGPVVKFAMTSGKRVVAAGPGNPPVIVDDTADIEKAARCIVTGASFDNNVLCTSEKEVMVFENVADRLIAAMQGHGARLLTKEQVDRITPILSEPGEPYPHPVRKFIGQNAGVLLAQIGITAGDEVRLVICDVPFEHPLVQAEMLMPILPIVRVKDLDEALDKAIKAEHGNKHSAMMHSQNISNMSRVAREIETTIFVKNAPSFAGLGLGGEGFTTLSIAGPTGEGLTSAKTFTRQRRCVLADAFRIV